MADFTGWSTGWNPLPPGGAPGIGTSILGIPTQYLGDLGMGLLAHSGRTTLPSSFGQRLGQAGAYASERRDQGILNDARRMEIQASALESQGLAAMQQFMMQNPNATDDEIMKAYTIAMPGAALKARTATWMSPQDRVQMQLNQANLTKLLQGSKGEEAETVTSAASGLENVSTVAGASKRLDDAGSIFQPGGIVESMGGLTAAAGGLSAARAAGIGGEQTEKLYRQVNDALTVSKATAALSRGLQAAAGSSPRSNFALQNIKESLASGVPWPAKRTAMIQNLKDIFLDVETQGIQDKIPEYQKFKELYGELVKQDTEWQAKGAAAATPTAAPPAVPGPTPRAVQTVPVGPPTEAGAIPAPFEVGRAAPGPAPPPYDAELEGPAVASSAPGITGMIPGFSSLPPMSTITQGAQNVYDRGMNVELPKAVDAVKKAYQEAPSRILDQAVPAGKEDSKAVSNANGLALNAAGKPVFKRWIDAERANQAGKLDGYDMIIVNGRIVDVK